MQWSVGNNQFLVAFIFLFIGLATAWELGPSSSTVYESKHVDILYFLKHIYTFLNYL